jgi:hypothetical protein
VIERNQRFIRDRYFGKIWLSSFLLLAALPSLLIQPLTNAHLHHDSDRAIAESIGCTCCESYETLPESGCHSSERCELCLLISQLAVALLATPEYVRIGTIQCGPIDQPVFPAHLVDVCQAQPRAPPLS